MDAYDGESELAKMRERLRDFGFVPLPTVTFFEDGDISQPFEFAYLSDEEKAKLLSLDAIKVYGRVFHRVPEPLPDEPRILYMMGY